MTAIPRQARYGRRHAPDSRDEAYILRQLVGVPQRRKSKRWTRFTPILDQGQTGTCVGFGWRYFLETAPVVQVKRGGPPSPFDIYDAAILVDEWSENDHDTARQMGTSVRAGAKALQTLGLIGTYGWEFDGDGVADWLGGVDEAGKFTGGSCVLGINLYDSMETVDREGFMRITPTARIAGGHCLCADELNVERGFVGGPNSWGVDEFGRLVKGKPNGRWRMAFETLDRLVKEQGEACAAVEIRRPKAS